MNFPSKIDIEKMYNFYITLSDIFKDVSSHIKLPEYSISIPKEKDEFYSLFKDLSWNNVYYISFFLKQRFFIKFDFLKEIININSESIEEKKKIEDIINKILS